MHPLVLEITWDNKNINWLSAQFTKWLCPLYLTETQDCPMKSVFLSVDGDLSSGSQGYMACPGSELVHKLGSGPHIQNWTKIKVLRQYAVSGHHFTKAAALVTLPRLERGTKEETVNVLIAQITITHAKSNNYFKTKTMRSLKYIPLAMTLEKVSVLVWQIFLTRAPLSSLTLNYKPD